MKVVDIGTPNLKDVPESLHNLAHEMENGDMPPAVHAIVVWRDDEGNLYTHGSGEIGPAQHEVGMLYMAAMQMAMGSDEE